MNADLIVDTPVTDASDRASRNPKLILHCGAHSVEMEQVSSVSTPASTASWQPIPHDQLIRTVQTTLNATNLSMRTQAHSLTHDGARYFGLMEIHSHYVNSSDYCWVLGLRNSHDKTFPAGIVAGASVFVCDNLSFSAKPRRVCAGEVEPRVEIR